MPSTLKIAGRRVYAQNTALFGALEMPDYEVLADVGQTSAKRKLVESVMMADMGDGYYRAAVIGSTEGTWVWTLNWTAVHRDYPYIQRLTKLGYIAGPAIPRGRYLIEFFHYHMIAGNKSFWFTDFDRPVAERIARLCHFTSPIFEMQQSPRNPFIYSYSVELMQSRGVAPQNLTLMREGEIEHPDNVLPTDPIIDQGLPEEGEQNVVA
jgi:hypothetical protein